MNWLQALLLGLVQGLTEFLPVSSSGHLMIFRNILGADPEGFLDFTVAVHFATVLSTLVGFRKQIWKLLSGLFRFRYNDETDYVLKLVVSMVPVAVVGLLFKDVVEAFFGESLTNVAICLVVTAVLLFVSDHFRIPAPASAKDSENGPRNGISWIQAFVTGLGQAVAVAPGLSRSGTTIATGLICGVRREVMAQFSFLMVLVPILGEQLLSLVDMAGSASASPSVGLLPMAVGAVAAFLSGLLACKAMVALVRKARLSWFSLYCLVMAAIIVIFL